MVWEFLRSIIKRKNPKSSFGNIKVGRALFVKDEVTESKSIVRVGIITKINNDYIVIRVPSINRNAKVLYDGVNYFIKEIE